MWGLFAIIGALLFSDFSKGPTIISEKVEPYVLSTRGKTLVIRNKLITVEEHNQEPIFVGDRIRTLDSTATVFWPDGSMTRLGEKSSIKIHEMRAKTANKDIQVDFSLEQGKSWSNVIKYMFGDSYFHERFNNDTALAAVRGTIFEVNLDRKYIHTIDHAVSIEDIRNHSGSTFVVAGGVLDTDTRKALIQDRIDMIWNKVNNDADIVYLNERMTSLKQKILENAGQTNSFDTLLQRLWLRKTDVSLQTLLTDEMRTVKSSGKLMDIYQSIYGLQNSQEMIDTKMKLRDMILETAPEDKKKIFLNDFARSTLYDSWSSIKIGSGSIEWLQKKLENYIKQGADQNLINSLNNTAKRENIQKLNDTLESTKQSIIETLGEKNLIEEVQNRIDTDTLEKINETTTTVRDSITDGLQKLIQ